MKKCVWLNVINCEYARGNYKCELPEGKSCLDEVPDLDSIKCAVPPSDLNRIASALERTATALEKANRLKALEFRKDSYVELDEVDEIMEG